MNRKQRRLVRTIAIVLAVLLAGSAVVSAVISLAYAEESAPSTNEMTLTMEYLEEAQALRMSQRLVYVNATDHTLDRVVFYIPANLLRRQSALPYDGDQLFDVFPAGYLPGGVDLTNVYVNDEAAEYGFQGENEMYLRVACELAPGESCTFEFAYFLLLTQNAAFLGISDDGWRLSGFYFAPASLDDAGEFILNLPLSFTNYADCPPMDVQATIHLPDTYLLAATGEESRDAGGTWTVTAQCVRDFALTFGKRYRESVRETHSGVTLRCLANVRGTADKLLDIANEALETCEVWFGPFPYSQLDFVQADSAEDPLNHTACLWLSDALLRDSDARAHAVRRFVAQQYFGRRTGARPSADSWLSDAISEFLGYLLLEEAEGQDAYLSALNQNLVDSLQLTIPGGLNVTSDASLFTAREYQIVVRNRGAAVFHELYTAMGKDDLLEGLRRFYEKGLSGHVLTEMDLVEALDEASGKSWEAFLTDWVFNIGNYVNQSIDWLD